MNEFAEEDGYEAIEDQIDRLIRAAGRTPDQRPKEKMPGVGPASDLSNLDTVRVSVNVERRVKKRFKQVVDESPYPTYGVAFARSLELYCNGGRAARLENKLGRIVDDAEALLSELNPEESSKEKLTTVERRTITICDRFNRQFTDEELVQEIHDVAGSNDYASKPTVEKYRELVIDRLDYEPHPTAPQNIWVPKADAEELIPDGVPKEVRRPVNLLDRAERVRRIQIILGRQATAGNGCLRMTATEVHDQVFNNEITLSSVVDLLNQVALEDRYTVDKSDGRTSVKVNLDEPFGNEELATQIRDYINADRTGTTVSDESSESDTLLASPSAVKAGLDTLDEAATDGDSSSEFTE